MLALPVPCLLASDEERIPAISRQLFRLREKHPTRAATPHRQSRRRESRSLTPICYCRGTNCLPRPAVDSRLLPKIRPATPADADVVARIYVDSWNAGFGELMSQTNRTATPELIERWQHDLAQPVPHRWWVAEQMGSLVGLVGIGPSRDPVNPRIGELDTIAVDPPYWREGIGKALISLAVQHLVSDGYREAILWTVEGYERGIAFYEAMGWTRDGGVRDNGRQVRFRRDLNDLRSAFVPLSQRGQNGKQGCLQG